MNQKRISLSSTRDKRLGLYFIFHFLRLRGLYILSQTYRFRKFGDKVYVLVLRPSGLEINFMSDLVFGRSGDNFYVSASRSESLEINRISHLRFWLGWR